MRRRAARVGALRLSAVGALHGELRVPGDKSITHRALLLAALATGKSRITGGLDAADTRATARALNALGAHIDWRDEAVCVQGTGASLLRPSAPLDLGNSGTGLRLLAGALAGLGVPAVLDGDASLRRRPMARILQPLAAMGAAVTGRGGHAPLRIEATGSLHGIDYQLPVASAQVKSALLLAGLAAAGTTRLVDPFHSRDHTERMLPRFGGRVRVVGEVIELIPGPLRATDLEIPGDFSSAAFLIAATLLVPGSRLLLRGVGINPTRTGFLTVLGRMGAGLRLVAEHNQDGEPRADMEITHAVLTGTHVAAAEIPSLIDELPILMVLAAVAHGETKIEGIEELRHKESDRVEALYAGLSRLGVGMRVEGHTVTIHGGGLRRGGEVDSQGDHRVAMAFAVAGLAAPAPVSVTDAGWIATSFPGFATQLATLGARVDQSG